MDQNDRVRIVNLGTNKIFMKREDPYGFIHVSFEKGQVPNELTSVFTSFAYAEQAVERYLNRKKRKPSPEGSSVAVTG